MLRRSVRRSACAGNARWRDAARRCRHPPDHRSMSQLTPAPVREPSPGGSYGTALAAASSPRWDAPLRGRLPGLRALEPWLAAEVECVEVKRRLRSCRWTQPWAAGGPAAGAPPVRGRNERQRDCDEQRAVELPRACSTCRHQGDQQARRTLPCVPGPVPVRGDLHRHEDGRPGRVTPRRRTGLPQRPRRHDTAAAGSAGQQSSRQPAQARRQPPRGLAVHGARHRRDASDIRPSRAARHSSLPGRPAGARPAAAPRSWPSPWTSRSCTAQRP